MVRANRSTPIRNRYPYWTPSKSTFAISIAMVSGMPLAGPTRELAALETLSSRGQVAVPPLRIQRIMVSPTARENPRRTAATIPTFAAGSSTFRITSERSRPNANPPSLSVRGTAPRASSATVTIVGRIKTPRTSPQVRRLRPDSMRSADPTNDMSQGASIMSPKYASTTVGTLDNSSTIDLSQCRSRLEANSLTNTAQSTPIGTATPSAMRVIVAVPNRRGRMPNLAYAPVGDQCVELS
ncbi:MAG: hypothetical protein CNCCGFBP_02390 [Fimbriimonadaceae bacterium]|nr:hypothetical protein [Fimbriimonadaceae bacterium]